MLPIHIFILPRLVCHREIAVHSQRTRTSSYETRIVLLTTGRYGRVGGAMIPTIYAAVFVRVIASGSLKSYWNFNYCDWKNGC